MRSIPIRDHEWTLRCAPLDDQAMQQHIRSLALTLNPDGKSAQRPSSAAALRAVLTESQSLAGGATAPCASLEWLLDNGRIAETMLLPLLRPAAPSLPAIHGMPRVSRIMQELVRHGDGLITEQRLTDCLIAFDEVRSLTMDEIWSVPAALSAALYEEYLFVASVAIRSQKARLDAMRWLEEGAPVGPGLRRRSSAQAPCAVATRATPQPTACCIAKISSGAVISSTAITCGPIPRSKSVTANAFGQPSSTSVRSPSSI